MDVNRQIRILKGEGKECEIECTVVWSNCLTMSEQSCVIGWFLVRTQNEEWLRVPVDADESKARNQIRWPIAGRRANCPHI